jgi:hypothetical protein
MDKFNPRAVADFDPLESRLLFSVAVPLATGNVGPRCSALTVSPNPAPRNSVVTLVATASDSDGLVRRVEFYRDANNNRAFDRADVLVGADTSRKKGWRMAFSTAGLPAGNHRFFARAIDDDGASSRFAGAALKISAKMNLVGTYTGTITSDSGPEPIRMTVTRHANGTFAGTLYSPEEGATMTFNARILKNNRFTMSYSGAGITGTASGTISADGRTLTGTYRSQEPGEVVTGTFTLRKV